MRLRGVAAALLACLCVVWSPAWAQERKLVIGVEELDYYPAYSLKDGEYVGAAREILDAFAAAHQYRLVYRPLPIKRLFAELNSGGIDLKFPDSPNWSPDAKAGRAIVYSKPVIQYIDGVLVQPGNLGKGPDAIQTLGTVSGFTPMSWMDRIKANALQVRENPRLELLLKQAVMGRVDGAYASVAVAHHTLETIGSPRSLIFDPRLPHSRDAYRLSTLHHPDVVAQFDAWMTANAAQVKAIKDRLGAEKGVE